MMQLNKTNQNTCHILNKPHSYFVNRARNILLDISLLDELSRSNVKMGSNNIQKGIKNSTKTLLDESTSSIKKIKKKSLLTKHHFTKLDTMLAQSSISHLENVKLLDEQMQRFEKKLPVHERYQGFNQIHRCRSIKLSSTEGYRNYKKNNYSCEKHTVRNLGPQHLCKKTDSQKKNITGNGSGQQTVIDCARDQAKGYTVIKKRQPIQRNIKLKQKGCNLAMHKKLVKQDNCNSYQNENANVCNNKNKRQGEDDNQNTDTN